MRFVAPAILILIFTTCVGTKNESKDQVADGDGIAGDPIIVGDPKTAGDISRAGDGIAGDPISLGDPKTAGDNVLLCQSRIEAIAAEISAAEHCTAVVRLDLLTLDLLGYQFVCGPEVAVAEQDARIAAAMDPDCTNYGLPNPPDVLSPDNPTDHFVFWCDPVDFGGVAVVSAQTGLLVFAATTVWMGTGGIGHPSAWRDSAELARGSCPSGQSLSPGHYYYLTDPFGFDVPSIWQAIDVVEDTVLTDAFAQAGAVPSVVGVLYPRTVGAFDPSNAEWIVLVD